MKKILSIALAAILLFGSIGLFGCEKKTTLDDIKKNGKLIVYTEAGFPPYEFVSNNKLVGVDIAIMEKVAEKLGVTLEIQDVNFDSIIGAVQSGKANVGIAGITINAERSESVNFSIPYSSTEQYMIVAQDNNDITCVEDLAGKEVGVQNGTTSDLLVESLISDGSMSGAKVTPYNTPAMAAAAIGKIDAVVTDKLTAQIVCSGNAGLKAFPLVYKNGSVCGDVEQYGVAVTKGSDELLALINEVLNELLADGSIDKWVVEYSALAQSDGN